MLIATFDEAPSVPTQLRVGDFVVSVTNAGFYAFLLEKGVDYYFDTYPRANDVIYSTRDDLAAPPMTTSLETELVGMPGVWTRDGGEKELTAPSGSDRGHTLQMPTLTATPDIAHLGSDDFPATFEAVMNDFYRTNDVAYNWACSDLNLQIVSPNSRTTLVHASALPDWTSGTFRVTASVGSRTLQARLEVGYGTDEASNVLFRISFPQVTFINDTLNAERIYPLDVTLLSDVPTNGTIRISHAGQDQVIISDTPDFRKTFRGPIITFGNGRTRTVVTKRFWFYSHLSGNGEMGLGLRDRVSRLRDRSSRSIPRRCGSPLPSV